jgi:transcriptional regulator with XRE-family HTH domain
MVALGGAVRALRLARGFSQEYVALESGLQRRTVWTLESGRVDPRYGTLRRVCAVLGVTVAELCVFADERERRDHCS